MSHALIQTLRNHRGDFCRWAAEADKRNIFPKRSVALLRQLGLIGAAVPLAMGGLGFNLRQLTNLASTMGKECLSTALIWSMHSQQVVTLAQSSQAGIVDALHVIATKGALVASVTSEYGKGGDILRSLAPLSRLDSGLICVDRRAPIVSYGAEADYFLITMKADEQAHDTDVRFVLGSRADGEIAVQGEWHAMGVRGTQSIPMHFRMMVDETKVISEGFRELALSHFVPAGQILWAASWLGSAQGLFERVIDEIAHNRQEFGIHLKSQLFVDRVAAIRIQLLSGFGMLESALNRYEVAATVNARDDEVPVQTFNSDADLLAWVNSLKVHVSELVCRLADDIMTLAGFARGYRTTSAVGVERVYRDLISARFMFNNDVLRRSIGTQTLARNR